MSSDWNKFEQQRNQRQEELRSTIVKPVSFEMYEKTEAEKQHLKDMKREWKKSGRKVS